MKVYSITTPETLERSADVTKWASNKAKVLNYTACWKEQLRADPDNQLPPVTLEIGRQAQLFRNDLGKKTLLATMYVKGARQFVVDEGLVETR